MKTPARILSISLLAIMAFSVRSADNQPPEGFTALFNGRDFTGWKVPDGDNGHWKIVDGAIDYDAESEAGGTKVSGPRRSSETLRCMWTGG